MDVITYKATPTITVIFSIGGTVTPPAPSGNYLIYVSGEAVIYNGSSDSVEYIS